MNRLNLFALKLRFWHRCMILAGVCCAANATSLSDQEFAAKTAPAPLWRVDFPTVAKIDFVTTLTALSNGNWHAVDSNTRVQLSHQLEVLSTARTSQAFSRKTVEVNGELVEISGGSFPDFFSNILQRDYTTVNFSFEPPCSVTSFFADESVRWRQQIKGSHCSDLSAAEDGSIWLSGEQDILNLRADGTLLRQIAYTELDSPYRSILGIRAARGANRGGAFIIFRPKMASAPSDFGVAYIDANGQQRWQYLSSAVGPDKSVSTPRLTLANNGGLYVGGSTLTRLDASGVVVAQFDPGAYLVGEALAPVQGVVVLTKNNSQCGLSKFSSANVLMWRTPVSCDLTTPRDFSIMDPPVKVSNSTILVAAKNHIGAFTSPGAPIFDRLQLYDVGAAAINPSGTDALFCFLRKHFSLWAKTTEAANCIESAHPSGFERCRAIHYYPNKPNL